MKRSRYVIAACIVVALLAGALWLVQAIAIRGHEERLLEEIAHLRPPDVDETPRLFWEWVDEKIRGARRIQFYCVAIGGLAAAATVYLIWWRRSFVFLLRFQDGKAKLIHGRLSPDILNDFEICLKDAQVIRAEVWARVLGRVARLGFSSDLAKGVQQCLRNVWANTTDARKAGFRHLRGR